MYLLKILIPVRIYLLQYLVKLISLELDFSEYREYPDFHERAKAAGYTVDPDYFKKNTSSHKIAGWCVVWIVAGFIFQVKL